MKPDAVAHVEIHVDGWGRFAIHIIADTGVLHALEVAAKPEVGQAAAARVLEQHGFLTTAQHPLAFADRADQAKMVRRAVCGRRHGQHQKHDGKPMTHERFC